MTKPTKKAKKPVAKKKPAAKKAVAKKRVKAGTSKQSAKDRKLAFAHAYIANGQNGVQAAITAGCPPKGAGVTASRWLKDANVKQIIADSTAEAAKISGLSVERTLKELARLAYADVRKLYDTEGNLIPIHQLDDDTAATIAGVDVEEIFVGRGEDRIQIGQIKKVKQHSKDRALDMAMKYHKLYSEDAAPGTTVINKIYYGNKPK